MKIKLGFLVFSIVLGLLMHLSGLFWLETFPFTFQTRAFDNSVAAYDERLGAAERQERSQLLAEIFEQIGEENLEVKSELYELKAEYAPHVELTFPTAITCDLSCADFAFENSLIDQGICHVEGLSKNAYKGMSATLLAPLSSVSLINTPPLAKITFEDDSFEGFGSLASSEHFDIQVEYAPKRSRPGYVFKVTLLPHGNVEFKRIRQNFYFLIDRSNSIPRVRYALNKQAVAQALDFLKPGDCFNILVFDDRVVRFQPQAVEWSEEAASAARDFLDRQGHGGYFAATELYASLGKIIPQDVAENEINSAILLSDGDTFLSQEKQRLTIGKWTAKNKGKVSLYTLASGPGNNLPLLDLLSAFNKGVLVYTPDHHLVNERLAYLMRTLQHPIGKEMVATAFSEDKSMSIMLQPKQARIPDLYQNRPFVIYGTTNKLSDFVLFLQGKYYDKRFDIKKKISFEEAKMESYSVERNWTQLLVQEFYERYFEEGNASHLESAKQLLVPLNLPTPLID